MLYCCFYCWLLDLYITTWKISLTLCDTSPQDCEDSFFRLSLFSIVANPACPTDVCADGNIQWMWNEWKDGEFIGQVQTGCSNELGMSLALYVVGAEVTIVPIILYNTVILDP